MAVIDGKVPPAPAAPAGHVPRVVVRFRPDARLPYTRAAAEQLGERDRRAWKAVTDAFPGVALEPYFTSVAEPTLRRLSRETDNAEAGPRLTSFYAVACPQGADPQKVARAVAALPGIELAYVEAGPTPPPVTPGDDPLNASQGYQDAAPAGIDARWAWGQTDGTGIRIVDLERGWTLTHEDLAGANVTLISGLNTDFPGHGTAVLGEVVGVDNTRGVVGIAPGAIPRVVSQWRTSTTYSTADAITSAVAAMSVGDVLLIEAQTTYNGGTVRLPVEVEAAAFAAIQAATLHGVTVVEAGGNGSSDLDTFQDVNNKRVLTRGHADFRDSGAVMVGAGSSAAPHARLGFSNFGSRVDCYAWGENVATCGDGWMGNSTTGYTTSFGGTSGATPVVAGAAVLLQSWRTRTLGQPHYAPARVRELLSEAGNTDSATPGTDRIGRMPNLRRIIERETPARGGHDRWMLVVQILFGVTQDGGGVVIVPGRGPVPVGPWGPLERLAPEKRDILVGLAMTEVAALLGDEAGRREMDRAALGAMRKAVDRLSARA